MLVGIACIWDHFNNNIATTIINEHVLVYSLGGDLMFIIVSRNFFLQLYAKLYTIVKMLATAGRGISPIYLHSEMFYCYTTCSTLIFWNFSTIVMTHYFCNLFNAYTIIIYTMFYQTEMVKSTEIKTIYMSNQNILFSLFEIKTLKMI